MRIRPRVAIFLIVCAGFARTIVAAPCETLYAAFTDALTRARLPEGANRRVFVKVSNAWRTYGSGTAQSAGKAAGQLNAAAAMLNGAAGVPDESRDAVRSAIAALSACMATPLQTATVPVRVYLEGTPPRPAGAGVSILVDGEEAAKTAADGTAIVTAAVGLHQISAQQLPDLEGHVPQVEVAAQNTSPVDVTMRAGVDLTFPARLEVAEAPDAVLSKNFKGLSLQLFDDADAPIRLRRIDMLAVISETGAAEVSKYFTVRGDGTIALSNAHGFAAAVLKAADPVTVRLRGRDTKGFEYRGTTQLSLGRYTSTAQIVPPAGVTLDRGSIFIALTNNSTNFSYWSRSSPSGNADFPQLPPGTYLVTCDTVQGKKHYFGRTAFTLDADKKTFQVPLFTVGDRLPSAKSAAVSATSVPGVKALMVPAKPSEGPYYIRGNDGAWHREDEDRRQKVFTVWLQLRDDGTLAPVLIQDIAWPEPLLSATEEELTAARADDDAHGAARAYRLLNIRAYDDHARLIFRANASVLFEMESEGHVLRVSRPTSSFNIPAETRSITVSGWMAQQDVNFDLKTLISDPRLRTGELMRR